MASSGYPLFHNNTQFIAHQQENKLPRKKDKPYCTKSDNISLTIE